MVAACSKRNLPETRPLAPAKQRIDPGDRFFVWLWSGSEHSNKQRSGVHSGVRWSEVTLKSSLRAWLSEKAFVIPPPNAKYLCSSPS